MTVNPLPPLTEEEYERLKVHIEVDGVLDPVELCAACGAILDGHNRTSIAAELDIECPTRDVKLPLCSKEAHRAWAWKRNEGRRQLDPAARKSRRDQQKADAVELRKALTQAETAALLGVSQGTISKWESTSNIPKNSASEDKRRKLSDDDIETIVRRLANGETQQSIAESLAGEVQVTQQRVSQIASENRHVIASLPCAVAGVEIRHGDCREAASVDLADLAFFSPPYNVGITYDGDANGDGLPDAEWRQLVAEVMATLAERWKVARVVINVPAALDRVPYRPVRLPEVAGLDLEAEIIWDKNTTGNRTTWGSWRQPGAPRLRDRTERLYVYRTAHDLRGADETLVEEGGKRVSPLISSAQFTALTQDIWQVPPESAQSIGHPAPFPVRLAENVIRLYGWEGCTVVDPFGGSGTTGVAAASLGCKAVLIDQSETYCRLALRRLMEAFG